MMTSQALHAGPQVRLVTHVPGATRGGHHHHGNHSPQHYQKQHHGHLVSHVDGLSVVTNGLIPSATSHGTPHHNPHAHARYRLAHHSIMLPPAAIRHVTHLDAPCSPCSSSAAAAAAASQFRVRAGQGTHDCRRRLVTRARTVDGAKEVDENSSKAGDDTLDRVMRSSQSEESVSFSFDEGDNAKQSDKFDINYQYSDAVPEFGEFSDARVPSWVTLTRRRWSQVTMSAASAATVPFLFLTMPQIVKNASLIAAGRPEALAAIAWQGQVAGLLGNLLLLSYFTDKGELSASVVQGVGVCATAALLTQVTLAGHIPVGPFSIGGGAVISGVAVSLARLLGKCGPVDENGVPCVGNVQCDLRFGSMDDNEFNESKFKSSEQNTKQFFQNLKRLFGDFGNTIWSVYQGVLGVVGLAALPQVGLQSLLPTEMAVRLGFYPGLIGGSLGVVLVVLGRLQLLPPALATAWGRLSGWTATLLFMTMPVAQLASNFARPATLEGLSVWSSLLAMLGNALMVPRALYTRDVIWLTGSTWGCTLMGWGVMLSLFLGTKLDGTRYIDAFTFGALTATFFLYLAAVWFVDGVSALAAGYHAGWRLKAWNFHGAADEQPRTEIKKKIREASGKAE